MGFSWSVVLRRFLIPDEMVHLFDFVHDREWERLVWGNFDREVLIRSSGRLRGYEITAYEDGILFPCPPPLLLDGGDTDADALDDDAGTILSPPLPDDNNDDDDDEEDDSNEEYKAGRG